MPISVNVKKIKNLLYLPYHKKLNDEDKPIYSVEDKKIIAWSICWEGCICLVWIPSKRKDKKINAYAARILLGNTNYLLLKQFYDITKIGRIYRQYGTYTWVCHTLEECQFLLREILPYLPAKKEQALGVLRFVDSRLSKANKECEAVWYTDEEIALYDKLRQLNKKKDYLHTGGSPPIESYSKVNQQ